MVKCGKNHVLEIEGKRFTVYKPSSLTGDYYCSICGEQIKTILDVPNVKSIRDLTKMDLEGYDPELDNLVQYQDLLLRRLIKNASGYILDLDHPEKMEWSNEFLEYINPWIATEKERIRINQEMD